mmetsp:Transcript_8673/g.22433  ORF Transcript_8673/g.22433 Transcript_8673/m.22433 type:complete len:408 (+) Transcript_8673:115-1338(+)
MDEEKLTFENSFWSPKDNDFSGFEVLTKRMKDGKHMYDEISDFISKRIKIEQSYAKQLQDLVKSQKPCSDTGTTKTAWEMLKVEVSKMATLHLEMANEMKENVLFNVNSFREKQRDQRKKTEDAVLKAQKSKLAAHQASEKAAQKYIKLCKEADRLTDELDKTTKNQQLKDIEKVRSRSTKATQSAENADAAYRDANNHLDHCRRTWEREMVRCAKQYEMMEDERLSHQRNALWVCMNIGSAVAVEVDKRLEMCRQTLETIDVEKDIQQFIKGSSASHGLGASRPERVPYISYKEDAAGGAAAAAPRDRALGNVDARSSIKGLQFADNLRAKTRPDSTVRQPPVPQRSGVPSGMFKAAYKYAPQGPQEIALEEGALVKVIERTDSQWWKATSNGRTGMVPATYLKPL